MNWYAERNRKIKKAYAEGETCAELAEKWGLGVEYVRTIIKKEEIEPWKPRSKNDQHKRCFRAQRDRK